MPWWATVVIAALEKLLTNEAFQCMVGNVLIKWMKNNDVSWDDPVAAFMEKYFKEQCDGK
jgi:hypothetical protein